MWRNLFSKGKLSIPNETFADVIARSHYSLSQLKFFFQLLYTKSSAYIHKCLGLSQFSNLGPPLLCFVNMNRCLLTDFFFFFFDDAHKEVCIMHYDVREINTYTEENPRCSFSHFAFVLIHNVSVSPLFPFDLQSMKVTTAAVDIGCYTQL